MNEALEAEVAWYGDANNSVSVRRYPPNGEDDLNDMAQAWLDGDMPRYERLLAEHLAARPREIQSTPRSRDRSIEPYYRARASRRTRLWSKARRIVDRAAVRNLRAQKLSITKIAEILGCSTSSVFRVLAMPE